MSSKRYTLGEGISAAKTLAVARLFAAGLNLLVQLALIRALLPDDYAVFLLCTSFATALAVATMLGVDRVVYRHVPTFATTHDYRSISKLFLLFLVVRLLQSIVLLISLALLPNEWLPSLFNKTLSDYLWPLVFFCTALSITDSLAIYASSLGLQRKQSMAGLVAMLTRACAILLAILILTPLSLGQLLWWFVTTEIGYAIALAAILFIELSKAKRQQPDCMPADTALEFRGFLMEGVETQVSYLLRLPYLGSSIRLIVALFAGPAAVAAFGFFQTLADRLYQFLPLTLFKGILEPGLAADYTRTGDPQRIATALSLLLRLNLAVLVPVTIFLIAGQETFATLLAGERYASFWHLAPLAIGLIVTQFGSEMLWTGLNPMGDLRTVNRVWRWCCSFGFILLCLAATMQSIEAIIIACMLPNFAVIVWLRYVQRHPLLQSRWSCDGFISIGKSAGIAALPILAIHFAKLSPQALVMALLAGGLTYLLLLKHFGLFTTKEVAAINEVAPRAARIFKIFTRGYSV